MVGKLGPSALVTAYCACMLLASTAIPAWSTGEDEGLSSGLRGRTVPNVCDVLGPAPHPCSPRPQSSEAFDALMGAKGFAVAQHLTFIQALQECQLEDHLKDVSRNRVVLAPSGHAMETAFLRTGLLGGLPGRAPSLAAPRQACLVLKKVLPGLAVPEWEVPVAAGCHLVYTSRSVFNPLQNLIGSQSPLRVQQVGVEGGGFNDTLHRRSMRGTESKFSVLGTGYNAYVGYPLSGGITAYDPGFSFQPIFELSDADVLTLPIGGACQTQFASTTKYSAQEAWSSIWAKLSISWKMDLGALKFGFSASGSFSMIKDEIEGAQMSLTSTTAKVLLGGYSLNGKRLTLGSHFLEAVTRVALDPTSTYALRYLVDTFGTHYINRVYHGGLVGMSYTMSARNKASLDSLALSARFDGSMDLMGLATVSLGSGSVTYKDYAASSIKEKATQLRMMLIPSGVELPMSLTSTGGAWIDCPAWTMKIQAAYDQNGWQAPVDYNLATIASLLATPTLFPANLRSLLPRAQQALESFVTSCAYSDSSLPDTAPFAPGRASTCPALPSSDCVQGSYHPAPGNPACLVCFDGPNAPPNSPKARLGLPLRNAFHCGTVDTVDTCGPPHPMVQCNYATSSSCSATKCFT